MTLIDPSGLMTCDSTNVGSRYGVSAGTVFSPNNNDPETNDLLFNIVAVIAAFDDATIFKPGDNYKDVIKALLEKLTDAIGLPNPPNGIDAVALLAQLKNFEALLKLNANRASVWTKLQCKVCRCKKSLFGLFGTSYEWENDGDEKWSQCQISETEWSKTVSDLFFDDTMVFFDIISKSDGDKLIAQCDEQAVASCKNK
jgi:hypothetical protein